MQITQSITSIPYVYCPYSSLAFARDTRLPYQAGLHFVVFAFVRELRSRSLWSHFCLVTQRSKLIMNDIENPSISTTLSPPVASQLSSDGNCCRHQLPSDFRIDEGFWRNATKIVWGGFTVNIQLLR
ncbi:hypothetical protein AVEN_27433-1 [Araneus ventricosus]|uniref:Uncharacterized protein n=1 Tax=Araneus ventricosus TaxID=182803 RepID=A0A4Y2EJL6_ARAVE|nr:hypothetical protein AVEN_27433-1 [Araneus ventricosus]